MAKQKKDQDGFSAQTLKRKLDALSGQLDGRWEKLRFERALSWLKRSERERESKSQDRDVQFILLWVALDSLFGREQDIVSLSRSRIPARVAGLMKEDHAGIIWEGFYLRNAALFRILQNRYIFNPFWKAIAESGVHSQESTKLCVTQKRAGHPKVAESDRKFADENRRVFDLLARGGAHGRRVVARIIFQRLGTLRNQLMHGSSAHLEGLNRSQVEDGHRLLSAVVPRILHVMMESPDARRGAIAYPPFGDRDALFDTELDGDEFRRLLGKSIGR